MLEGLVHIQWLGVVLATFASSMLGGLWFTAIFPKAYFAALGRPVPSGEKPGAVFIVGPMVCSLVTVVTTALLLHALKVSSMGTAVGFGLLVGLGYLAPMVTNIAINPNFPRPFAYASVVAPYFLLSQCMSTLILFATLPG